MTEGADSREQKATAAVTRYELYVVAGTGQVVRITHVDDSGNERDVALPVPLYASGLELSDEAAAASKARNEAYQQAAQQYQAYVAGIYAAYAYLPSIQPGIGSPMGPAIHPGIGAALGPAIQPGIGSRMGPGIQPGIGTAMGPAIHPGIGAAISPAILPAIGASIGPSIQPGIAPAIAPAIQPAIEETRRRAPSINPSAKAGPGIRPSTSKEGDAPGRKPGK